MPNYWPLSSGNWSSLSNWVTANTVPFNASILPTPTDDVFSNNRIIYIDGNYQVNSIRNISATNIAQGGHFVLNDGFALSAFVYGGGVNEVACLQFLSAAPASATLVGNLCAGDPSATVLRPIAFRNTSSGNFTIIGNSLGGFNNNSNADVTNANNGLIINDGSGNLTLIGSFSGDVRLPSADRRLIAIRNQGNGTISISGQVFGGRGNSSYGVFNNGTNGNIFILGPVQGGTASNAVGAYNNDTGTISISGLVLAGAVQTAYGAQNQGNGTISIVGEVIPSSTIQGGVAVWNQASGTISLSGRVQGGGNSAHGITNNISTGIVNVTGQVVGIGVFSAGINNNGILNVVGTVAGVLGNSSGGGAIFNSSTGVVRVSGVVTALNNSGAAALDNGGGIVFINGPVIGWNATTTVDGQAAIRNTGQVFILGDVNGSANQFHPTSNTIVNNSNGFVSITGNITGPPGNNNAGAISNAGPTSTVVVSGQVTGGSGSNSSTIRNESTGSVFVIGNVTGGVGSGAAGLRNLGGGVMTLSGSAIGGAGGSGAVNSGNAARMLVRRAIGNPFGVGSTGFTVGTYGVIGAINNTTIVEEIESGSRGMFPTNGNVFINRTTNTLAIYRTNTGQSVTMFTSLSGTNLNPITRDVRQGVVYDFGALVGTLAMPIPAVVNAGVPVDNTVGTGVFTPIGVWSFPVSAIASTTSMGGRVKNSATIDSIGALIKNLT